MYTIPGTTFTAERKDWFWTLGGVIFVSVLLASVTDGWGYTVLPWASVGLFAMVTFADIYPEYVPPSLRPRPAVLPGIVAALVLSVCLIPGHRLIYQEGGVQYVVGLKLRSPFSSSIVESAPPLKGTLVVKQLDSDAEVIHEDERAWFDVTVTYDIKNPHDLTASEWAVLQKGLPTNELPLSFDAAPDKVVRSWLAKNLPHVTSHLRVEYHSPIIVWE